MSRNDPPSEKISRLFYSIGFALTQWQHVENSLTELFGALLGGNSQATSAAFNTVLSTRVRLLMIRASASVVIKDAALLDQCVGLCYRMDKKASKRNELAHFMLFQDAVVISDTPTPEEYAQAYQEIDWYLSPTFHDGARGWRYDSGIPQLRANDAMNRARSFIKAAEEIKQFTAKVRAALKPPPARV